MKKIITFIFCCLILYAARAEQIDNTPKKSILKAKIKIMSGYFLTVVSLVTCVDAYCNIKCSIFSYDNTYRYVRFNFNETVDRCLIGFQRRHPSIANFAFGPGNMLLGIVTGVIGHELSSDGRLDLEEIRGYERLHQIKQ